MPRVSAFDKRSSVTAAPQLEIRRFANCVDCGEREADTDSVCNAIAND
jgi:hypothetical protein